jgi:hypothetical protein
MNNEKWAKLPPLDIYFMNDFCGFIEAVVFSENMKGLKTCLFEYGRTQMFQEIWSQFLLKMI